MNNVFKVHEKDATWAIQYLLNNDYYLLPTWQKSTILAIALGISAFSEKP